MSRILEPFDGQKDGHRDNYVLVVDEGIARYMEGLGQQVGDRDECALDWVAADVVTVIGASVCGGVLSACERSAVILDRAERDAMLESVGHIFAMEGDYLGHGCVGHEREGVGSAIGRLTAGAGILDQLGWVREGDRDSYRLGVDGDISELMREWVCRLTQGGVSMDPVDQPMIDPARVVAAAIAREYPPRPQYWWLGNLSALPSGNPGRAASTG